MKIAVLSTVAWRTPPLHYGPWEQMASNLTEGLVEAGHEVTLFATGSSQTNAKLRSITEQGYEEDRNQDAKVIECLHIAQLMESAADFDLIHNHFDFLPLSYTGLIDTPVVTTIHGFSSEKIIPVYKKYNAKNYYVSISESNRHPDLNYLATVYNGIDTAALRFQDKPEGEAYLLFFGRIHPHKGTEEAIAIAKKSKQKLIIAGIIQDQQYFTDKIEPQLSDQIIYAGSAGPDKRNELMGNAIALLHPISFDEPFGLSVAESMLCGTPVIAFNRGSMPELIKDGETGFLVNNIEEAAESVSTVPSLSRALCREWSAAQFSKEKMVADYISLYHQILS